MTDSKVNKILVIIPAFNESEVILSTVRKIQEIKNVDYLVVNDCSYDSTLFVLKDNHINFISNSKNLGLSQSIREGIKYALINGYDYCIQFDGDGQHDEKTIPKMIEKALEGYEIILTSRFLNKIEKKNILKNLIWYIFKFSFKIKGKIKITDPTCGLRMFNKRFMKIYSNFEKLEVEPSSIMYCLKKLDFTIVEIPTVVKDRISGESFFKKPVNITRYIFKQLRRFWITTHFWNISKRIQEIE